MRMLGLPGLLLCLVFLAAATCGADTITSHLGHEGPAFAPGMTPSALGWGPNNQPYPDKFVVNPRDGAEMAWVPPGEFLMGSTQQEQDYAYGWLKKQMGDDAKRRLFNDEGPQHKVRITRGFWLYRHPVTNAQYRRFLPDQNSGEFGDLSLNGDKQPVVKVPCVDARDYCQWAGTRLPTEAEWEYACRAGTQTKFWWGDSEQEAGRYANVADRTAKGKWPESTIFDTDDGYAVTAPVGSYKPNPFGLFDMIGNVWQWCADWYGARYYANSPVDDPRGHVPGEEPDALPVRRGGSWRDNPSRCRSAHRTWSPPGDGFDDTGFRCARTP